MKVAFNKNYSAFSLTQKYQNTKLFKIMAKELSGYRPRKILDVGCGDAKETAYLARKFPHAEVVGIDISEELIEEGRGIIRKLGLNNVRLEVCDYFDFREDRFDVVVSNNVFHWFGKRGREGYRKLAYHLTFGGFFFIHQGGRWSYIALRYLMEKMLREMGIEPPPYPLFYPTKRQLERILEELGYSNFEVRKDVEHEVNNRQIYIDFTYAGGLPYISLLPREKQESFRKMFVRRAVQEECPAFPVRLYVWGRYTPELEYIYIKQGGSVLEQYADEIEELLKEVDEEFVPPLSARSSTTQPSFGKEDRADISPYLSSLLKQGFIAAVEPSGRVVGFLSFIEDYEWKGKKWVYVSTIAVRSTARGLGVGRKLYEKLLTKHEGKLILTRTWTGNTSHMKILRKTGFEELERIPDHRGRGIDTVYMGLTSYKT